LLRGKIRIGKFVHCDGFMANKDGRKTLDFLVNLT